MGRGPTKNFHKEMNPSYTVGSLTCLKSEVIMEKINPDFPLVLNIEPTNACNLKCIYCPREEMIKYQGIHHISLGTFQKIIDEASRYGKLIMLNLHKDGEPLLNPHLPEMITYAKKRGTAETIHLNTNGTLLHKNIGTGILEAGIDDITISIDAAFGETYSRLKRNSDFEIVVERVENFIALRDRIGAPTFIRVKIMEFDGISREEIESFFRKWENVADQVLVTGIHNWSGAIKDLRVTDEFSEIRHPCALLWYALAVNSNGSVSICNVDWNYTGVVGNIKNDTLHRIWNDRPIRNIRKNHLESGFADPEICRDCVLWAGTGDLKSHFKKRPEFL
jgi:radical SAM protein with 4Fe4S-binding SPASM domain